jgi:phosphonate ABC transporter, ATP-binding protein
MNLLEIRNLTKYYNKSTPALNDISFNVQEGEFVAVIGPSGAGKSTLLRCVNRMIEATGGEVIFAGSDVLKANKHELRRIRTRIGMVFQHYNLVDRLTVIENILHGRLGYKSTLSGVLGRYSEEEKRQAFQIIDILGLTDHIYQRCDQLSGGQKQRVGIGRALVQNPRLILCDEPIASLDPHAARIIMDHLRNICDQMKITVVVNLHQVQTAVKYADRIIGIKEGRVAFNSLPEGLFVDQICDIYGTEIRELSLALGERNAS